MRNGLESDRDNLNKGLITEEDTSMDVILPTKAGVASAAWAVIIAALMIVSIPAPAAQAAPGELTELSIEELLTVEVYSASKFVQRSTEAPASVSVVTVEEIKVYGYRTLADILRSVRGMFVTYDRDYQYVGVRGFNRQGDFNSRILLLVDGYRVNDAVFDTASIGTEFFLDVDLIDRVEVVRGPGSSIYGSNAFFAVVNVITKRGRDFNGLEISGEAASFGTGNGRLTYGRQLNNGVDVLLSAAYLGSEGQNLFFPDFNTPATNNGIAHGLDGETARRVYGKLAFEDFTLIAAYSERIKDVPTASFGSLFNDPRTRTTDSQAVLDLGYYKRLSERLDLSARLYYGGYFYEGTFPYDQPPIIVNKERDKAEWWGTEVKVVGRYDRHKLVVGAEFQDNFRQDLRNFDIDPSAVYTDEKHSSNRAALYFQDELTITRGLLLNAGMRYDKYSTLAGTLNPRLALIYSPREATTFKLLYSTAFRAPNAYELYYASAVLGSKPGQGLKPEKITTYEFIVEHQLQPNFRFTVAAYYNEISDLINQITDTDGLDVFRNIGQVKAKGVEFEVERAWVGDTRLRVSYAWQITRNESTGGELENSPRHLAKLNFSMPLFDNAIRTGAELQYTSSRKTLSGSSTRGYAIANLTLLSQKLAKGLEVSASCYNLFDRRYSDPGRPEHVQDVIQQDGRNFRFKLSYRF